MSDSMPRSTGARQRRLAWFSDLESLQENLSVLRILRDDMGLTTLVPESHICHNSGFKPSPDVIAASPVEGWRDSPTLHLHRAAFHVAEPAFAVLPGVVDGFDDTLLLRVIDECRRLGLEVWGHAGLWSYGGEVFPALAARPLFGGSLPEDSLSWGTGFCPSKPSLNKWIKQSLVDVTKRYDLDGMFLDHARYTSPGYGPGLFTCGCPDCEREARVRGYDPEMFREGLSALRATLTEMPADRLAALAAAGPVAALALVAGHPGVLDWFIFRARLLADKFTDISNTVRRAAHRPFPFGADVFPASVALLGGHLYREWAQGATYLTGGFTGRIGWSTVGSVTIDGLSHWLGRVVPNLNSAIARQLVTRLIGYDHFPIAQRLAEGQTEIADQQALTLGLEIQRTAAVSGDLSIYPPIAGEADVAALRQICRCIVDAGVDGAMFSGLDRFTTEQRAVIRTELAERILS